VLKIGGIEETSGMPGKKILCPLSNSNEFSCFQIPTSFPSFLSPITFPYSLPTSTFICDDLDLIVLLLVWCGAWGFGFASGMLA
jgi:hypothetical protein